jgi:hypothetical protein
VLPLPFSSLKSAWPVLGNPIDSGWREVAEKALAFVRRFVSP